MTRLQEALELKPEKVSASAKREARDTSRIPIAARGRSGPPLPTGTAELPEVGIRTLADIAALENAGSFRDGHKGGVRPLLDKRTMSPPSIKGNGVTMTTSVHGVEHLGQHTALTMTTPRVARLSSAGAAVGSPSPLSPRSVSVSTVQRQTTTPAPTVQRQTTPGSAYRCAPMIATLSNPIPTGVLSSSSQSAPLGACGTPHTTGPPQLRTQPGDWLRQPTTYQSVLSSTSAGIPVSRMSLTNTGWCQLNRLA